ncbi:hypothetical protein [Streptomyces cacaoi]|uniref:hypothetical protein n=1 Tax=Streptomyces cacaoi TaxID=1898 RepID=UPI003749276C
MIQEHRGTPPRAVPAPAPHRAGAPAARRIDHARADCTADSRGGLAFAVRLFDETAADVPAHEAPESAAVLLRLRQQHGPDATVRLPLARAEAGETLHATLAGTALLREGRWDAHLDLGGEELLRLLPGMNDLRSLAAGATFPAHAWLGVRIPYTTKHGNLSVRAWLRRPHAEAGALHLADGVMELHGTFHGVRLDTTAHLEARPRDAAAAPVRVPVRPDTEEHPGQATAPDDGPEGRHPVRGFTTELPLDALLSFGGVWDLWLRPAENEEPVRVARILDDVLNKKRVFSYPAQQVTDGDGTAHPVRPYYTVNNNLSVEVG